MIFQILMVASMKVTVFWDVSLVEIYRRLGGT
jgi:hypothetical protein